jgi:uncharacterized membrane protein
MESAMRSTSDGHGHTAQGINVGNAERLLSVIGGGALALFGLHRIRISGLALIALGAALIYRGVKGHCGVYESLGIDRAATLTGERRGNRGIKVEREVSVAVPPEVLYRIWRDLGNLPRFMSHLERVDRVDDRRSRWTLKTPTGVPSIQWDAEIVNDRPGELIAWQSAGGSVDHAGSVQFERVADGRSTRARVALQYDPPGGEIGHTLAALFGQDAGRQIEADLAELKRAVEAGEMGSVIRSA